jgi:hypothetical protein
MSAAADRVEVVQWVRALSQKELLRLWMLVTLNRQVLGLPAMPCPREETVSPPAAPRSRKALILAFPG